MITITAKYDYFDKTKLIGYSTDTMSIEEAYKFVCQLSQNGFDFVAYAEQRVRINFRTKAQLKNHDEFLKYKDIWFKFA
jgi:hypothetical protein